MFVKQEGLPKKEHRYSKKVRIWTSVGISVMALLGVLCITASSIGMSLLSRIDFVDTDEPYDPNVTIPTEDEGDTQYSDPIDPEVYDHADNISDIPVRGNEKNIRNILLLGVDSNTFNGRSDAMILLSVNDKTKSIRLISFMRDTWVTIPGRDRNKDGVDDIDKLNAAYAYGKFTLLKKTVEQNFRLKIDEYMAVNFKVLPILIDSMGGLDIELTSKEMARIPAKGTNISHANSGFVPLTGKPGVHHLNGFQAMEYARIRKIDSDFKRTERQRIVITKLLEKAKDMSTTQLISMVTDSLEHVRTNMSADDLIGLAANAVKYRSYTIENAYHLPQDGAYKGSNINGGSGLQFKDLRQSITDLHKYIYG